jgi:hypothetical protein
MSRAAALAVAVFVSVATLLAGTVRVSKEDAERFQAKLTKIVEFGNAKPSAKASSKRSTAVTDIEVNSYIRLKAADQIPVGVTEPELTAVGDGRVAGRAIVDLDAVRKQKQRGWLDPLAYLGGQLPITAAGHLTTKDGKGQFVLESAEVKGVPIPKAVVQELLSYYSRTPENPGGIDMDAPFELPARIKEIRVGSGTSTVVQ